MHIKELMELGRSGLTERWLGRGKMSKIYYEHAFKKVMVEAVIMYNQSIKKVGVKEKRV